MLRDTAGEWLLPNMLRLPRFSTPPSLRDTSPIFCIAKHPAMLRGTARERLMSGLLLSLFFQPLCHYVPPSPLWLRYTLQCFGARQGRSLKVTLYSYRLSHNNGERRGKFFCEKRLFCYLSSAKRRYKLWGNEYI